MTNFLLHADQEDRQWAIKEFREGRKDVLVATDIASKGLDFQGIQHVINYDMPTDIENYGGCGWLSGRGGEGRGTLLVSCVQFTELAVLVAVGRQVLPLPSSTRNAVRGMVFNLLTEQSDHLICCVLVRLSLHVMCVWFCLWCVQTKLC